jgi:8-oxo-dGTP diphosphatase
MDRPVVGTSVIIIKDGKVLLGKRKKKIGYDQYQFCGGKIDMFEDLEDGAAREAKEETNLDVKNVKFITATNDVYKEYNKHYITLFFVADYAGGELKNMEPDKADDWDWYDWDNLPEPLFLPIKNLLKQGFNPFEINENK